MNNPELKQTWKSSAELEEVRKLKEWIAAQLGYWFLLGQLSSGRVPFERWLLRADSLLRDLPIPLYLDMGEQTDEEILAAFDSDFAPVPFDHKPNPDEVLLIKLKLIAKAARAKFVSIGEIVKEAGK